MREEGGDSEFASGKEREEKTRGTECWKNCVWPGHQIAPIQIFSNPVDVLPLGDFPLPSFEFNLLVFPYHVLMLGPLSFSIPERGVARLRSADWMRFSGNLRVLEQSVPSKRCCLPRPLPWLVLLSPPQFNGERRVGRTSDSDRRSSTMLNATTIARTEK